MLARQGQRARETPEGFQKFQAATGAKSYADGLAALATKVMARVTSACRPAA